MTNPYRRRYSGELTPTLTSYTDENYNTGVTFTTEKEIPDQNGELKYMFDVSRPGYIVGSRRGKIFNNPMHSTVETRSAITTDTVREHKSLLPPYDVEARYTYAPDRWLTDHGGSGIHHGLCQHVFTSVDVNQLVTLAGTQAQANVADPMFHGLTFVAELGETITFLLSPLRAYHRWLKRQLRKEKRKRRKTLRGRRGNPKSTSKKEKIVTLADLISSNWLSYRYGAMPIVYDVQDAIAAITRLAELTNRTTARGYSTNYGTNEQTITKEAYYASTEKLTQTKRTVEVRAGILYEHDSRDTFGVHMSQIPKTAWEVVPFSFVADWFVNVDDFISAITPKVGVTVLSSWTTIKDLQETEAQGFTSTGTNPGTYLVPTGGTSTESYTTLDKKRTPSHEVGIASRPIPFNGDLGTKRVADSLSLIFQLLKAKI